MKNISLILIIVLLFCCSSIISRNNSNNIKIESIIIPTAQCNMCVVNIENALDDIDGILKYEVELIIHKQTGVLLGYYYDIEARGDWNEWLNLENTLDLIDVSHHFVEAVVEPEPKSEPTQTSGGCGAGTVLVNGVCQLASTGSDTGLPEDYDPLFYDVMLYYGMTASQIIGVAVAAGGGIIVVIFVVRKRSKTPKPAKQKPVDKEETSAFCESCGKSLKPTAKFCGGCGTARSYV